jgi:UDPglucose--hexose-1-phosphate uridylyltransferase
MDRSESLRGEEADTASLNFPLLSESTILLTVSEAMRPLPRHVLFHPDGRRLLVYGELHGSLDDEAPAPADEGGAIHKRLDVFTDAWLGIAPARNARPLDSVAEASEPCPFCPGGTEVPFPYEAAVFDNRFPSFRPDPPTAPVLDGPTGPARGRSEVVLYTHRHEASFGDLSPTELGRVVAVWIDRACELWSDPAHAYVCVFENRGAEVGATIAHPHGQIYALDHIPPVTAAKAAAHRRHRERDGVCLSCAAALADDRSDRIVSANDSFVVAVPFATRWPFGVDVRARRHGLGRLADLVPAEQCDLALALRDVARRYDALFGFPLPYMMVAHEAPSDQPDWHLAFELYPLHRAPEAMKIRASVETGLGLFLNDVAPEDAARRLAGLDVPLEPIELDSLFTVTQPERVALP